MKHPLKVIHFEYETAVEGDWQGVHQVQSYDRGHPIHYHEDNTITESHLMYLQRDKYHFFINISLKHAQQYGKPSAVDIKSTGRKNLPELWIRERPIVELLQNLPHKKKLNQIIKDFIQEYQDSELRKKPRCGLPCTIM